MRIRTGRLPQVATRLFSGQWRAGRQWSSRIEEAVSFIFEVLELEIFAQGELDMEVVYEDGEWELALLDEANERELSLIKPFFMVAATRQSVPADVLWVLRECRRLGMGSATGRARGCSYAGIAGDEIESGLFEGKQ